MVHHNNRIVKLNHFLIKWKSDEHQIDLISGTGIHHAFCSIYHEDSFPSIETYEQVYPIYFNEELSNGKYLTFTIFVSKSGYGLKIRWIKGQINADFRSEISKNISKTYFTNESEVKKYVIPLFNSIYK